MTNAKFVVFLFVIMLYYCESRQKRKIDDVCQDTASWCSTIKEFQCKSVRTSSLATTFENECCETCQKLLAEYEKELEERRKSWDVITCEDENDNCHQWEDQCSKDVSVHKFCCKTCEGVEAPINDDPGCDDDVAFCLIVKKRANKECADEFKRKTCCHACRNYDAGQTGKYSFI